ncbi:hypothetical protein B0I35DRAFT_431447 [Stachybotrys elegans]|uniref:Uncharacterized protein n=1 Tax=Stachybotrys elegans TaxID=80388 RepID=A0A8K0SR72_9HYPO|nr:hypothetical protein B0I35DRAFT_431447 [Stachybotrys elegans]
MLIRVIGAAGSPSVFFNQQIPKLAMAATGLPVMQSRRVATTKITPTEGSEILANQRLNRPISPHLGAYKLDQTYFSASAWNRITGCILSGSAYAYFAGYLVAPLLGWHWESASLAAGFAALPFAAQAGLKTFFAFPFAYHFFQGTRHIVYDLGLGYAKQTIKSGEKLIWGLSAVSALGLAFGL